MSKYEEIKKECGKKANKLFLITGFILILVGLLLALVGGLVLIKAANANKNICVQDPGDLKKNQWYTIETNTILSVYALGAEGKSYVTWIGENYEDASYISLFVPDSKANQASQITEDTQAYLNGQTKSLSGEWLKGKGYIRKMQPKEQELYEKILREYDIPVNKRVMYTFSMVSPWRAMGEMGVRNYFIFGLLFVIIGLVFVIVRIVGGNMKAMKKEMGKYGVTEQVLASDMENALSAANVYVGKDYSLVAQAAPHLFVNKHLVWIYPTKTVTTNKAYGIKVGQTTTYSVAFCDRDGRTIQCPTKSEDISREIVQAVHVRAPYVICGYNPNVENAINNGQIRQVAAYVDRQRKMMEISGDTDTESILNPDYGQAMPQPMQQSPYAPKPEQSAPQYAPQDVQQPMQQSPYAPQGGQQPMQQSPYAPQPEQSAQQPFDDSQLETSVLAAPYEEQTSAIENPFEK